MAVPLKATGLVLCCYRGMFSASSVRCMAEWKRRKNGPLSWMIEQLPSGRTSYAIQLTQMQNDDLWAKRMDKVNRHWKQTLRNYNKIMRQREASQEQGLVRDESPPKLLMVKLVKTLGGRPYWEKDTVKDLKLEHDRPVILKNKENINVMLKEVKHLVEIHPITFPNGLPDSEDDYASCVLRDNGEFIVTQKLSLLGEGKSEVTTEQPDCVWNIQQKVIDDTLERKKVLYMVHQEYFPTRYLYKRNEDGKEYRYKGDHTIGFDKIWY